MMGGKSEIRNPKQIQIEGESGNEENGGPGGSSANFANFREFLGREILTAKTNIERKQNHDRTESWGRGELRGGGI
jgi:hypothetical protein